MQFKKNLIGTELHKYIGVIKLEKINYKQEWIERQFLRENGRIFRLIMTKEKRPEVIDLQDPAVELWKGHFLSDCF